MPVDKAVLYKKLGMKIKLARLSQGYTAKDLGAKLSRPRSRQSISALENGTVRIQLEDLIEIADLVDETLEEFLRGL